MKARYFYGQAVVGGVVVVAVGVAMGSVWLIFCGCAGPLLAISSVVLGRKRASRAQAPAWEPTPGARVITPVPLPPLPLHGFQWTGGCNVPGELGRTNATFPLSTLMAAPGWARIDIRPRSAQRLFGYQPLTFEPNAATTVFPVKGRLQARGVGFQAGGQPPSYFWTTEQQIILTALAGCGFGVRWQEVRAKIW